MTKKKGGYRKTEFGEILNEDPNKAAEMLRSAWKLKGGATDAAKSLDISRSSFFRYARRLEKFGCDVGRVLLELESHPSALVHPEHPVLVGVKRSKNRGIDTVRS